MEQFLRFTLSFVFVLVLYSASQGQVFVNYDEAISIDEGGDWRFVPELARVTIDVEEFPLAEMAIALPADAALFVDEIFWTHTKQDSSFRVSLEEVRRSFPDTSRLRNLVIYKKGIRVEDVSVKKGLFRMHSPWEVAPEAFSTARVKSPIVDFFFVLVLTSFFMIALFKMIYPTVLSFILHPVLVFSTEDFSESNSRLFTAEVLFFLVIFNMLLMGVIMISASFLEVPILEELIDVGLNQLFSVWLLGTGVLVLVSLFKFLWLKVSALIFGISKIEFIHFFYMLRVASIILIGMYVVLVLCFANDISSMMATISYLLKGFFALYILGVIMLFFMMVSHVSLKNYHLFSYLCTAELVPFLVLSKLIIG